MWNMERRWKKTVICLQSYYTHDIMTDSGLHYSNCPFFSQVPFAQGAEMQKNMSGTEGNFDHGRGILEILCLMSDMFMNSTLWSPWKMVLFFIGL